VSVFRAGLALAAGALLAVASPALAHQGSPDYLSQVRSIAPALDGLTVEVLNRDDRLAIRNDSGRTVVVEGYNSDPYVRLRGDGRVEVNTSSQAYYLNEDRYADAPVPARVKEGLPPRWKPVSRTGRFEWHDHRMHYMGKGRPSKIEDPSVRQTVFDWKVPIEVDGRPGAISGRLLWTPREEPGLPLGAIFAFAAVAIAGCVAVIVVRRRRAGARAPQEAW
jgi:hypothetical protein